MYRIKIGQDKLFVGTKWMNFIVKDFFIFEKKMSQSKVDPKKRKLNSKMKTLNTTLESSNDHEDEWMSDDEEDNTICSFDLSEIPVESNIIKPFPMQCECFKQIENNDRK